MFKRQLRLPAAGTETFFLRAKATSDQNTDIKPELLIVRVMKRMCSSHSRERVAGLSDVSPRRNF
jgi:hypothetical protein